MAVGIAKQTKLWSLLENKIKTYEDIAIIKKACEEAEDLLGRIPDTFPTYTLHDGRHCLNVCNLMFELLGNQVYQLTGIEVAFLILSAFYHDIGMTYTPNEKAYLLESQEFVEFRKIYRHADKKINENNGQVPDDIAEWFFRSNHAQRMGRVPDLFIEGISIKQELIALCKSHGSNAAKILYDDNYKDLIEFNQESADLVFCAILLRLADILDFDQSRAPDILYEYLELKDANTTKFESSKREFLKHKGALGFTFPYERQNEYKIRFNAQCDSIEMEHDIRSFLDVINREFRDCANLLSKYKSIRWNKFTLPTSIDVKDSYGTNYQYGQYLLTVDHDKALKLFTGEGLYPDKTVFVRELLQNAIDTALHRQLYEKYHYENYSPEVHVTTWTDEDYYQWIRVDDNGMGMDERKIREYFLKAAESYYTSDEFVDEISLYRERKVGNFTPISRFGIGVLSCFLAGDRVEVSTRTHRSKSVRLSMKLGEKYFTTQLEEKGHKADPMPVCIGETPVGYRQVPGTSIAVRVQPYQHFSELSFENIIRDNILYPPIPIYLNKKRFVTENEFLTNVDKIKDNILNFPIPESAIDEIKRVYRVTIHPGAFIKIVILNLRDYVSKQNTELLNGALFLLDGNLSYTDEFYEINKMYFDDDFVKATIKVNIENHRVKMKVFRFSSTIEKSSIPPVEMDWYLNKHGSYNETANIDLNIDMSFLGGDSSHLTHLPATAGRVIRSDESWLMQNFAHNGIAYFSSCLTSYRCGLYEHKLVVLCREKYRPELAISRTEMQSLSLELLSEIFLAIRKAFDKFNIQLEYGINSGLYPDFRPERMWFHERFDMASLTIKNICELINVETKDGDGWYDYFNKQFSKEKFEETPGFLSMESLTDVIFATWIQNYKQCKLTKQQNGKYSLSIDSVSAKYNNNLYIYYPPLSFLPIDGEHSLVVRFSFKGNSYRDIASRCFINMNNPDAERIISNTEALNNQYPALFRAFVTAIFRDNKETVSDLIYKFKALPLWNNS